MVFLIGCMYNFLSYLQTCHFLLYLWSLADLFMCQVTCTAGSSMFAPSISDIAEEYDVPNQMVLLGQTTFLCLLGIGPLILAPMSETFGKFRILIVGEDGAYMCVSQVEGRFFSQIFSSLLYCRFQLLFRRIFRLLLCFELWLGSLVVSCDILQTIMYSWILCWWF